MRLQSKDIVNAPVDEVYRLARDELPKLVPHLTNIDRIEVRERKDSSAGVHLVNHWFGKADIPSAVRKFMKPELLSWKDTADWNDAEKLVDYRLESFIGKDLFSVTGRNRFAPAGDGRTELSIQCDIDIYPERLPGVPKLLAGMVKPAVEDLIRKMLEPNLTSLAKGLNLYYSKR